MKSKFWIIFTLILFSNIFVDAAYGSIYLDKGVYTWTDKVHIRITEHGLDLDGTSVKVHTSEHELNNYKLSKAGNGLYTGEIILTGFLHDVDGDGKPDTNPRTEGSGPNNGFLETKREGEFTITVRFADGDKISKSAMISWNKGSIIFDKPNYALNESANLQVTDADMNLNPKILDTIQVYVYSDSDKAGIQVDAIETEEDSGLFEAMFSFTQTNSFGNKIHAIPGDVIYAKYEDATLPSPNSVSDSLDIQTEFKLESDINPLQRISNTDIFFTDTFGQPKQPTIDQSVQIAGTVQNNQDYSQSFVYLVQILDEDGVVISFSWITGQLNPNQNFELSVSWTPTNTGNYLVETYVWDSLQDPNAISHMLTKSFVIENET